MRRSSCASSPGANVREVGDVTLDADPIPALIDYFAERITHAQVARGREPRHRPGIGLLLRQPHGSDGAGPPPVTGPAQLVPTAQCWACPSARRCPTPSTCSRRSSARPRGSSRSSPPSAGRTSTGRMRWHGFVPRCGPSTPSAAHAEGRPTLRAPGCRAPPMREDRRVSHTPDAVDGSPPPDSSSDWMDDAPLMRAWRRFVESDPAPFTIPGHKRRADRLHPDLGSTPGP